MKIWKCERMKEIKKEGEKTQKTDATVPKNCLLHCPPSVRLIDTLRWIIIGLKMNNHQLPIIFFILIISKCDGTAAVDIETLLAERVNSSVVQIVFGQSESDKVFMTNCNFWRNLLRLHLKNEEDCGVVCFWLLNPSLVTVITEISL